MTVPLPAEPRRGIRLWVKVALVATAGVVAMHTIHLLLSMDIAGRSLVREQATLGQGIARLVAAEAADPLLTHDGVALSEAVGRAAAIPGITYCFVLQEGKILATSFRGGTPEALVALRGVGTGEPGPIVVVTGERRTLDLQEPILGGQLGAVRVGIDMSTIHEARRAVAVPLGWLALAVIVASAAAALLLGRAFARPIEALVSAANRFRPDAPVEPVPVGGGLEIELLAERFNEMMVRLRSAHAEQLRVSDRALASERLAALGTLVAGVAHEVNNPLTGLKAAVQLLREEERDPVERRQDLDMMDQAIERLREVVARLLDLGRVQEMKPEAVPPLDLAREALRLAQLSARGKRISISEIGGARVGAPVRADRKLVSQGLLNLLLNAAYFTPEGGQVRIRLRRRDGFGGIAIVDDGPGIAPEHRARVLEPFFTTKPGGEGTGLGLALTRSIADRHGGSLELECPPEGGTIATLWLPLAAAAADEESGEDAPARTGS